MVSGSVVMVMSEVNRMVFVEGMCIMMFFVLVMCLLMDFCYGW